MRNILVIFGGESVEHEVSVLTGLTTLNAVKGAGYNAVPVFVDKGGAWYTGDKLFDIETYKNFSDKGLKRVCLFTGDNSLYFINGNKRKKLFEISTAINCMHGGFGEDGTISAIFRASQIPLASPNHFSSAVSMDKEYTKIFLKGIGVKSLPYATATDIYDLDKKVKNLNYPLIVKPSTLGSSIGIKKVDDEKGLSDGVLYGLRYADKVIIEPFLEEFTEINCAVYQSINGVVVSEIEKPIKSGELLDFNDKYISGEREFPAKIDIKLKNKIQSTSKKIYKALGFRGVIRIDFMIKDGEVFVCEINSVPGSLAYYLFGETTEDFSKVIKSVIDLAVKDYAKDKTLIKTFNSSLFNITGSKGQKRLKKS